MSSAFGPKDLSGIIVFPQGQALRDSTREGSRNIRRDAQCSAEPMQLSFPNPPRLCSTALNELRGRCVPRGVRRARSCRSERRGAVAQNYALDRTAAHDKRSNTQALSSGSKCPPA